MFKKFWMSEFQIKLQSYETNIPPPIKFNAIKVHIYEKFSKILKYWKVSCSRIVSWGMKELWHFFFGLILPPSFTSLATLIRVSMGKNGHPA